MDSEAENEVNVDTKPVVHNVASLEELAFQMSYKSICADLSLCPEFLVPDIKNLNPYSSFLSVLGFRNASTVRQLVSHRLNHLVGTVSDSVRSRFLHKFLHDSYGTVMSKETIRASALLWVVLERSITTLDIKLPFPTGEVDSEILSTVAEKCPDLDELCLNFSNCYSSTSFKKEHLTALLKPLENLPKLKSLTLYDLGEEFVPVFNSLGLWCPQLKTLRIHRCGFKPESICDLLLKDSSSNPLHGSSRMADHISQLQIDSQYLHPFCQTLEELSFMSAEQKEFRYGDYRDTVTDTFASPSFLSFALRHCPNLKILRSKCLMGDAIVSLNRWEPLVHPTLAPTILWLPPTENLHTDIKYTDEGPLVRLVPITSKRSCESRTWDVWDDTEEDSEDKTSDEEEELKENETTKKDQLVPLAKFQTLEGRPDICRTRFTGRLQLSSVDFIAKESRTIEAIKALCDQKSVVSLDILDDDENVFPVATLSERFLDKFCNLKRLSLGSLNLDKHRHILHALPPTLETLMLHDSITVALEQLEALNSTKVTDLRLVCSVKNAKDAKESIKDVTLSGITHLSISACHTANENVEKVLFQQPRLTHLHTECVHSLSEPQQWLEYAEKHWKRLESLHVRSCGGLNAETIKSLTAMLPKLKDLLLPASLRSLKKERYAFRAIQATFAERGGKIRFGKNNPWARCYMPKTAEPWEGSMDDEDFQFNRETLAMRMSRHMDIEEEEDEDNDDFYDSYGSNDWDSNGDDDIYGDQYDEWMDHDPEDDDGGFEFDRGLIF